MCGLYGIINNGPKPFRKDVFTVLGITNDRRGGDSCGVFIDDAVDYGIGQRALFENFFWDCDLLNNTEVCEIALGHDRKASVGAITIEKAHPILIKNDKGKTDFVLVHNGTIHNYEDLAKEYIPNIDCSKLSDSQVLALILYHKGFDVLSKYNGGTAFVAVDYRKGYPETYMFKGASKANGVSTETTVERPLYFSYSNNSLIFSSIASVLCAMLDNNVYEAKDNKVYKYVDGKLYTIKTINRDNCQQNKIYYTRTGSCYDYYYIRYSEQYNIYKDEYNKLLQGKYRISSYGRILGLNEKIYNTNSKIYTVFFFNGIPFRDKFSFNRINKLYKKSNLSIDDFTRKNIAAIRFNSADKVFLENGKAYIALSEIGFTPFTGSVLILGSGTSRHYKDGNFDKITYSQNYDDSFTKGGYTKG